MGRSKLVLRLFNALYSLSLHFVCSVAMNSYFLSLVERYNREVVVVDPKLQYFD